MAADGCVHRAGRLAHTAAHDGLVYSRQTAVGKLRRQRKVCKVVFRDDQQAGRVLIYPVHDAWALFASDTGQRVAAMKHQSVYERSVRVAGRGVHDHAARFVYYQQVVILVHDVDRDILRPELCVGGLWHDEHDLLAG